MALFVNSNPYDDEEITYAQEDTGVLNEFGKGFGAGVDQLQALAGGAKALVGSAVGNDDWFYEGMEYFDEQMAEAAENTADVGSIEEIGNLASFEGLGNLANYSAFIVGNIIPSLIGGGGVGAVGGAAAKQLAIHQGAKALIKKNAEGMAKGAASRQYAQSAVGREALGKTGLKGQMIGATAFGTTMGAGESFTRILDETGEEAAGLALVTGLASGALDAMTPMRVLKRVLPQNMYGKAAGEVAENVSKKKSVITRALKEAGKASGTEGVTEMMQEIVQNSALEFVRGQQDPAIEEEFIARLFDEENRSQYLNAFVAGAIGGGAIGGVTGAVTKDPESKQNLDENALKGEPAEGSPDAVQDEDQAQDENEIVEDNLQPEATDEGGERVQAARAKALSLPAGRTTIALKSPDQVREEIDGLPEQREASDPAARQEEARAKARAQVDGLPAVREKVKEIYQMELGTLGETTRIPKDKDPEPVAEEPPVFGGNLPESITPRMEELVGRDVDYNGNKGPVLKKDDGFYVATQDNGDVLIESGEYQSPEQLGVVPTGGNLVFEQDVQIDDNNKFELRGKKYSLTRIIRDAEGNPLSLAVRDENGTKKTIRTPEVVARINNQKTPAPDFSQITVELDDLPARIQKQIIQQSGADSIPESVPASQAIEIAQSLPNAEAVVEGIREVATQNLTIPKGTAGTMPAVPYTENVTRPNMKPLAEAIAEINAAQGDSRTPIDQGRIDGLFAAPEVIMMNGERVTTAEGVQADEIKSALVDLLGSGMPKSVMNHFKGLYVHAPAQMEKEVDGSYLKSSQIITMNGARVNELIADKDNSGDSAINLRFNLAHEIGHAFDVGTGHTNSSPDFSLEVDGLGMNSATYEMGPVIHELGQNYLSGTELGQELAYPFGGAFEWIANSQPEAMVAQVDRIKKEAFAQAFAIFHSSPELLQEQAPTTYKHLETLLRTQPTEINQDGETDIRSNETDGIPQDVQGEVRSPSERGGDEVQEQIGTGGDGGSSLDAGQANQGVAEPTQRADGDGAGRAVQLEPTVKRAEDFKSTGDYNVTYPDGTVYQIARDELFDPSNPYWNLSGSGYDALGFSSQDPFRILGIGSTRKEALEWLSEEHSKRLERAEAESVQQELGDIDDAFDPMDDLADFDDDALYAAVSTRFPTAKRSNEDPVANILVNDYGSFVANDDVFSKNMLLVKKYNNLTRQEQRLTDKSASSALIGHVKENLLSIYDAVPEATRAISKQWYKGANKIVQRMAGKHGVSLAQASAVAANLSPQKDWYQNASLAERVMDIFHGEQSSAFDSQMKAKAEEIYFHKEVSDKSKASNRKMLDIIGDRSLQELIADDASDTAILGMWIRTWDQTYNDPSYRLVSPDGKFLDYAVNADGETQSRVAWGSLNEIGKAVSVLLDSSQENISRSLGTKNKVRNFYNNIFEPDSTDGFVTIDTHAVAAGLLKPLSGDSLEVSHNFGTGKGTSSSTITGHSGTYSIFEEAYRQAAADRGVLAREMQSITWEAVRGLFTSTYKAQDQNVVFVEGVWNQYSKGKLSLDEARNKINEHSGGIQRPDWERSDFTVPDEVSGTSYQRKLPDGGVPRQDSRPQEATGSGAGIDAAGVSTDQLDAPPRQRASKPNAKGNPAVQNAYQRLRNGEIDRQEYDKTVLSSISPYEFVPQPATQEEMYGALNSRKREKINTPIADGENVGLRLDIPAYTDHGVWVPTIHGTATSHRATAAIVGADFTKTPQGKAEKVMEGGAKSPFAQIRGSFVNRTDEQNAQLAESAINDPAWTQVGFDPRRHSYFYDRKTGQPVLSADEVIQVGPLVLAKNAKSGMSDDFLYAPTRNPIEIMSEEDLIASVRAGTTSGGESGIPSSGIKKWLQKNFSSRGLLPETAFDSMIQRDGEFGAVELDIRQMVGIYDNAVVENFGKIDGQQRKVLDDAMKRPASEIEATSLPRDIKDSLIAMRGYIDSLSAQYAQVLNDDINTLKAQGDEQALAKSELLGIVVNNMGTYANRSYQAFNNKDWNKEVPDEVVLAARNFLVEQGTANPDQVVNTILKEGTAYDDMASFIAESKLGAKDLAILTKRKQIAPEIRALLGEYKDPRVNFANSASKMSRLIYNDRFLKEVLASGNGVFLFDQESAPADATKKIAEVGSKTLSPLNGMYTYPEIEQAFRDALGKEEMGDLYRTIIKVNGLVKYGKTVIAPTTMARNFMSASLFTVANGHFNWSKLSKSAEVSGSYFSGIGDGVEYLKNLKKLGVVHDSPYAGEMIAYLQDANAEGILDQRDPSAILDTKDATLSLGKRVAQGFTKAYQFGDDFWKIVGFENEVMSFMENKGMSREEAEPLAAKRIRDTYPTYSLIGKIPQQLRRFPLVGTFVSFPAEIVRTQANMIKYLREDLADPDMRPAALKRITGMAMMSAGVYAAQAMAMSAFGVSEEEEEAIKLMAAPWAKNSNILVTGRDDEGRLEYLDLTHLDPYALMKRPLNALMRDQPIDDALIDASAEILKPFLGWDISTNTILEFISNEKSSGGEVYNDADTFINKSIATYMHFERGMGPSVIQNGRRMARAIGGEISKSGKAYDVGDEMGALVGFRKTTFDPKTALHFKAYEFSEGKRQSTKLLTSVFRDPNDVSDSDIREAFGRASTARRETFEDMAALVSAAMSSGLNATQAMTILRSNGVTKKDARALIGGGASAWTMSDSTLKNSIAKSDVLFGQQKSRDFQDRWSLIQQLLNEETGVER